ncbi:hypothetical protein APS56_10770 [Pseudalgibacter alginicilyticus]|uniref:Uncharacterized protein n=1 Tax=Pseudalgibacter alginicilyticus TaxID=1736674 RepID=A0A0P0CRV6_9FLAO|nr:hypothetical protein [Pseudalgibacter alginicilyticus]ALJ05575.1 hypothetical protein APS56_10770 [Pseudalgibacter alginicilyticus]
MSDIIKTFTLSVEELEKNYEILDMDSKTSVKSFEGVVLELLAKLKRSQDKEGNEDLEDDLEDLIYRVILILGQLDLLEI